MDTVGRFAPTPSGQMHLGNVFCALLAWLSARAAGGRMILRIEDLDPQRSVPAYARQMEEELRWLGLDWDEGGEQGGPHAPYWQSARTALYAAAYERLAAAGQVYPCFCTRAQLHAAQAPHASDGEVPYSGRCRGLSAEEAQLYAQSKPPAMRLRVPEETIAFTDGHFGPQTQDLATECGDFILRRADGVYAYQLAVVVDDAAMGVTQVVRGRDLLSSTPRQLYLYRQLGLRPPAFYHVPLLVAADGRRLAKRERDMGLTALRAAGWQPEQVVGRLAYLAGQLERPEAVRAAELVPHFSWAKVPREDVRLEPGWFDRA